jgi:transcriptional regulator with XRE-family HTH domain
MTIGERIKYFRTKKSMSQVEVADQLGVKQSTVANYEKQVRVPNIETAIKLSDILSVSLDELLKGQPHHKNEIAVSDQLVELILNRKREAALNLCQTYFKNYGLESLYFRLIRYGLTKVGWLWEVGAITISEQHQASYEINRLIEHFSSVEKESHKGVVVGMTVPGEKHTHGLRMLLSVLEVNYKAQYVGQAVPLDDLKIYLKKHQPDYLILSITSVLFQKDMDDYIESLDVPIILVGQGTEGYVSSFPHVVGSYRSYEACLEALR